MFSGVVTILHISCTTYQGCVRHGTGILGTDVDGRTELTEVSGTGIDVVPNLPKRPVPVLEVYRTYRSVRHRYKSTGIDVIPNLPKFPVLVLMSYPTYRSFRYRY